jgi:hypothetical protein
MFKLEMQTDTPAFGHTRESKATKTANLLRYIASRLECDEWARSGLHQTIHDGIGNDVGRFVFTPLEVQS